MGIAVRVQSFTTLQFHGFTTSTHPNPVFWTDLRQKPISKIRPLAIPAPSCQERPHRQLRYREPSGCVLYTLRSRSGGGETRPAAHRSQPEALAVDPPRG